MEKPFILHMFTPLAQMSPFDINMACDAGFNVVAAHTNVALDQVAALTQDTIFSRGPKGVRRTSIFIGGRDNTLAADMLDAAKKAMFPPFEVSVFVDPSGAFTTAAAMVACVERQLRKTHGTDLNGKSVMIFGGTGPVGAAAAVLAAQSGARVGIVGREDVTRARRTAEAVNAALRRRRATGRSQYRCAEARDDAAGGRRAGHRQGGPSRRDQGTAGRGATPAGGGGRERGAAAGYRGRRTHR